jgi:hypothetical protein
MLNPLIVKLAGRRHFAMAAQIRHVGRRSGRIEGEDYDVTQPQFMSRQEAKPLVQAAFSPMNRAGFRMLGIKQVMTLSVVSAEHLPGAAAAANAG